MHEPFRIAAEDADDLRFMPEATASDWATVFSFAERLEVAAGLAVLQAGEDDRALYLITEGTLAVQLPRAEGPVREIEAPAVVGELAFFDGAPRSATLQAVTDVEGARLDTDAFERLSAAQPQLATAMLLDLGRVLAGRLRRANDLIRDLRG